MEVVGHVAARRDAEDPEPRPVVVVEDQPRCGVRHRARLRVDLPHDPSELVVGQGLVGEALAAAVDHDAVGQRPLAQEHAAERSALQLLAGELHAGHPPGVLHAGEIGAHLLGELHRDAVVPGGRDLHAEGRAEVRRRQLGRALEPAAGQQDPSGGAHRVLVAVRPHDDPVHPRLVRDEPRRGRLDAHVDAVAQAGLQQGADQCRSGEPDVVDADPTEQPQRERVPRHARRQGRSHEPRRLTQPLGGVRAGEERPADGGAVDVGAVVRPERRDPPERGVPLDEPGYVRPGLQELLDHVVVEDLVTALAVDVAPRLVQVVVDLQLLGREAVVGDPGRARRRPRRSPGTRRRGLERPPWRR